MDIYSDVWIAAASVAAAIVLLVLQQVELRQIRREAGMLADTVTDLVKGKLVGKVDRDGSITIRNIKKGDK